MTAPTALGRRVRQLAPRTAIVLGTGLSGVTVGFREESSVAFGDLPGLFPPTVHGHVGRMVLGHWDEAPILLFLGRLHGYEGHAPEVLARSIQLAADWGVRNLVLTNAAGGINPELPPGSLMAIRRHFKLLARDDWRELARARETDGGVAWPYSARLFALMEAGEKAADQTLFAGVYAALNGPCYETPAEVRALAVCGAAAVGMSTAVEAETAAKLGLEVVAISCITNTAAGLVAGTLGHADVLKNAGLGVERLGQLVRHVVRGE